MKVPQAAIDIIKRWEGFRADAYLDSAGVWTVGYGTTSRAGVGLEVGPHTRVTEAEAEVYLRRAVEKFADRIRPEITTPMNENEWAAFLSLAYNIGPGAFVESTALRRFNDGDKGGAAEAMLWWNKVGTRFVQGLAKRRQDEMRLFYKPATQPATEPANSIWTVIVDLLARLFGRLK